MFLFCGSKLESNRTIHGSHRFASKIFVLDTKRKVCEFVGQYTGSLSNTYLIIKHKIDTFLGAYFFLLWNLSLTRISLSPFKKQEHLLVFYFWAFWVATVLPRASWEDGGLRERKERASVKWQSTLLGLPYSCLGGQTHHWPQSLLLLLLLLSSSLCEAAVVWHGRAEQQPAAPPHLLSPGINQILCFLHKTVFICLLLPIDAFSATCLSSALSISY